MNGMEKIPKFCRSNIEKYITFTLRLNGLTFDRLPEEPKVWKHSCVKTGVTTLKPVGLRYPSGESIIYAVCGACGKVLYYSRELD